MTRSLAPNPAQGPPSSVSGDRLRVVIVGGGLAGMAAAVALESSGAGVTLLEARKSLGGRAGSFEDPQTGEILDNCQHVLLGCCTNLINFYRRIGVMHQIQFERAVHFLSPDGKRYDLAGTPGLPAPLHLSISLLRFHLLTLAERAALTRAMLAMLRLGRHGRAALGDVSFGDWLDAHRQPASLVHKLYDPVLISALNEDSRRAAADYAIQVFQDALLANAGGNIVGTPAGTLGDLYAKLPCKDVRCAARVAEICFSGSAATGVRLASDERMDADVVILATNHHALRNWIPDELMQRDSRFTGLPQLESVPILGAHLWFDRPVIEQSHLALIDGPLQWVFRKNADGSAVHGVISAARDWVGRPKEECLKLFGQQIRATLPIARDAVLQRGVVVVEKRATFSPLPGADRHRPMQAPPPGGIENLYLAGDYTRTGWPATMEGAVRSGYLAAEAVLKQAWVAAGQTAEAPRFIQPDLPAQWPARMLGIGK